MPGPGTWSPGDVLTADDLNAIGVWTAYTPTLTQNVARSATVNYAEYTQINKMCIVNVDLTCTTTGSLASILVSLPVNMASTVTTNAVVGSGLFFDSSATDVKLVSVVRDSATNVGFFQNTGTFTLLNTTVGNGDIISFSLMYETV